MAVLKMICHAEASEANIHRVQEELKHHPFADGELLECVPYWKAQSMRELTFQINSAERVGRGLWETLFSAIAGEWTSIVGQDSLDMIHASTMQEVEKEHRAFFATLYVDGEEFD